MERAAVVDLLVQMLMRQILGKESHGRDRRLYFHDLAVDVVFVVHLTQ